MKGKIFKNQYGKLSLRGEDGNFYLIGKSLQQHQDGAEVEFDVTETTYQGKQQKWANAIRKEEVQAEENKPNATSANPNDNLLVTLIRGVAAVVNEIKETNQLLQDLLNKGKLETSPVRPKAPTGTQPKNLGDLPF